VALEAQPVQQRVAPPPQPVQQPVALEAQPVLQPVSPVQPVSAPTPEPDDELAEERAKAERLARIIVSDIVLYNADQFTAAIAADNVLEALETALQEGRDLFRQRIGERVRVGRDYLEEELLRVARSRGAG
jgi:hypothetical protein